MARTDCREFIEKLFKVELKEPDVAGSRIAPFILNRTQRALDESTRRKRKHVILKARQLGVSTYLLARALVKCLTEEGTHAVIISHERQATIKLLRKVKFMVDQLRKAGVKVVTDYDSKAEMTFPEMNSTLYIGTAGQKAFSRGDTVTYVLASEVAFWEDAEELMRGIMGALTPNAEVFIESTANGGGGYFYDTCKKADANKAGEWAFHFFPWTDEPLYSCKIPSSIPFWTPEELWLHEVAKLSWKQIMWRRKKLEDYKTLDDFLQEFPLTPEEAFIVSGTCYFDKPTLRKYQKLVVPAVVRGLVEMVGPTPQFNRFSDKAPLSIWEYPRPGMAYVISADLAEGTGDVDADESVAQVLNRTTFKQAAVMADRETDPLDFGVYLYALGAYYGWAWIAVEDNGPGLAALLKLKELGYPRIYHHRRLDLDAGQQIEKIGWHTDQNTRTPMLSELRQAIKKQMYHLVDARLLNQCTTFCRQKDGKYKANSGCHDDHVMAGAIGIYVHNHVPMDTMIEAERDFGSGRQADAVIDHGGSRKTGY